MMADDAHPIEIPAGYRAGAVKAGIKPSGGLDLALFVCDHTSQAAGTFTTNRVAAAPVKWDRAIVPSDSIRAIVVNAGNANAATGEEGMANVRRMAERVARRLACEPEQVLVASTGVIGRQLPMDRVEAGIDAAYDAIVEGPEGFEIASRAIMTTDTRPKVVSLSRKLSDGSVIRLIGMAKGAAMIGPNMATLLAFLFTDARVSLGAFQTILFDAVDDSFNCLSVEGHTSTNDTVLIVGPRGGKTLEGADVKAFGGMVREACDELAKMIADDGEGATHLIRIDVRGCRDRDEAKVIAKSVADDALVKTAIHGADPNWGRIVSAAGHAGVAFEEEELSLRLNGVDLFFDGRPLDFDAAAISEGIRANRQVDIELSLKRGRGEAHFWTCDLTAEYVRLNADYTT
jgi:glutamate N-acetyltransferase / amino-acid N-acetyltransferase